jgi:hypothetical protein
MKDFLKELQLHTLRGDIQQIGMETDYNKRGIRNILQKRFINLNSNVTLNDFNKVLSEEYKKVETWRAAKA